MIIVPFRYRPRTYRKQIHKTSEIVGVTCKVIIIISFLEKWIPCVKECMIDGEPTIRFDSQYKKGEQYGFEVKVRLSKKEYENNQLNLKDYVCEKVKEQSDYQNILNDCIEKYADGREYTVETFMPDDPDAIDIKWVHHECEEYVPI